MTDTDLKQFRALSDRCDALEALLKEAREMLTTIYNWADMNQFRCCPTCGGDIRKYPPHKDDCTLSALLTKIEEAVK